MLPKIICIILVINLSSSLTKANQISPSINSQLREDVEPLKQDGVNQRNCTGAKTNGIYDLLLSNFSSQPFKVACDAESHGGGWTIILRRMDGSVDFQRNWTEYKNGFGNLSGEFFLGLDKIHAITAERRQELLVTVEDFEKYERFVTYAIFAIGNEDQQYELHTLGYANGTAYDDLESHKGMKFTTYDRDNDELTENSNYLRFDTLNCAQLRTGGWWYHNCFTSHLTGTYNDTAYGRGVHWGIWNDLSFEYSLKRAVMMIRPIVEVL